VGNDAASGTTLLANKMAFVLENIKKLKLSEPSGIGQTSGPNPERVESPFAEISIDLITWELREAKRVFNGDNGQGFDDYLDALNIKHVDGVPLSETINNQFDLAIERAGNYDTSLKRTIAATPASVQLLIDDIQRLIILVKVDMISQLGILLIFNDNDGD
jgi:predicted lipoprotein